MTDHLATARRWLSTTQDSRSFDHLMSAMDQILAHLDAQQAAQEVTSAPQTAPEAESGQGDGDEAVRAALLAAHRGLWFCSGHVGKPPTACRACRESMTRAIAAAEPHIRAKTLAPIRAALANHPRCDIHPDDDPIKCGWKQAVASVQAALDKEDR